MQAHLGANVFKRLHQEVRRSHPELQRTEDMLDGVAPLPHLSGIAIEAMLHRVQYGFALPSPDAPCTAAARRPRTASRSANGMA